MSTVEPGEWRCLGCGRAFSDRTPGAVCPHDERVLVPAATAERFGGDALLGTTLAGEYQIFDILGLGGFGAVYRAVDTTRGGRHVAIKTIRPGAERHNADARARFTQEARLLERLRDPHIVQVYHYGEADDALFMALELVPGRSLKRILRARGRLSPRRAVYITAQILQALTHAHALGLVHRDLKPANILVVEHARDTVKVIDFGIAKVLEAEDEDEGPKTGTGLVLGTVRYMAPEQLRQGGQVGPATDLYAVGIMFYEMLTGQAPFDGSQAEIAAAHLYQPAPALDEAIAPPTLRAWVARVLLKNPGERFVDAAEMRAALLAALPGAVAEGEDETIPAAPPEPGDGPPSGSLDAVSGPSLSAPSLSVPSGGVFDRRAVADAPAADEAPADADEPRPTLQSLPRIPAIGGEAADAQGEGEAEDDAADGAAEPPEDAEAGPGSTLPDGAAEAPSVEIDPDLAALPDLAPERSPAWGDIDLGHAPTVLQETSGTIQSARGELGLSDAPEERRRRWWLVPALAAALAAALVWTVWPGDDGPGGDATAERISLRVGHRPAAVVPVPDVAPPPPVDAAPPADAAPDAAVEGHAGEKAAEKPAADKPAADKPAEKSAEKTAEPRRRQEMGWRQVEALEKPIETALAGCRCSQARGLLEKLPREFPRSRRKRLARRIDQCKVPLVDQQCVDGEVR